MNIEEQITPNKYNKIPLYYLIKNRKITEASKVWNLISSQELSGDILSPCIFELNKKMKDNEIIILTSRNADEFSRWPPAVRDILAIEKMELETLYLSLKYKKENKDKITYKPKFL